VLTVYVYFRVDPKLDEAQVRAALRRLSASLAGDGADLSVMRRLERGASVPDAATWMTVHAGVESGTLAIWLQRLAQGFDRAGVSALVLGERHVEVFEPVAVADPADR
jgi:hypothetical protein